MVWPISIIVGSVAAGALLGLLSRGRGRLLDAVRTFAIVSAVAVVVGRLIPHALEGGGPLTLLVVVVAFVTPSLIEHISGEDPEHDHTSTLGLEIGYWGLVLHKIGDGMALGAFTTAAHADHGHGDLVTAVAVHSIPVTALITLAFTSSHGVRSGVLRASGLAFFGALGVIAAQKTALGTWTAGEPWLEAAVSGLLLHVVTHDWAHEHERPALPGWPQVVAIALGISVLLLGR